MALEPNVRRQLEGLLDDDHNFVGQIVLHCKRSRVVELEVHRKLQPAPPDQEVVNLQEVARGGRR